MFEPVPNILNIFLSLPPETFVCGNVGAALDSAMQADDRVNVDMEGATVTALRMRFPADRQFVFEVDANNDPQVSSTLLSRNQIGGFISLV